jgi:hypothetical protein
VVTEVCVAFPALSAIAEGYDLPSLELTRSYKEQGGGR